MRPGKKTKRWDVVRTDEIKPLFAEWGITTCELFGIVPHECTYNNYRSFAHAKKRRFLTDNELRTEVILVCKNGHDAIEYRGDMEEIVKGVISNREII